MLAWPVEYGGQQITKDSLKKFFPLSHSKFKQGFGWQDGSARKVLRVSVDPAPASAFTAIQTAKRLLSSFQVKFLFHSQSSQSSSNPGEMK